MSGELRFMTSYLESQRFLIVTLLNYPNSTQNQILESWPLTVTFQIVKSLGFGELAVNSNSPIFIVVKLWRVSRNFMYTECSKSLQHVLQNVCCYWVDLILYLFISHVSRKLNIIEHTWNTLLGMKS